MTKTYSKISGPSWATVQSNGALILKPDASATDSTVVVQVTDGINTFSKSIAIVLSNRSETQYFSVVQNASSRFRLKIAAMLGAKGSAESGLRLKMQAYVQQPPSLATSRLRLSTGITYEITGGGGGGW